MYKFCFYVPESHLDEVKAAIFAAGAGRVGHYDSCCWQTLGQGQFRPLAGSEPFIGQPGQVEEVAEWKVELVVADELIHDTVKAMKKAHPYETPAFDVWRLSDLQFCSFPIKEAPACRGFFVSACRVIAGAASARHRPGAGRPARPGYAPAG